jgi:hypothetical protein
MANKPKQPIRIQSLLVRKDTTPLDKLLQSGWLVSHSFVHPEGTLFVLVKGRAQ